MKKMTTLKMMILAMIIALFVTDKATAQEIVEIPKDGWTAYAIRYLEDQPPSNAIDGDLDTKYALGGSGRTGRWFMIDLGKSYDVVKFEMTYIPGEEWKLNYIQGFDLYVTNNVYDVNPATGPKGQAGDDGEEFEAIPDDITASIEFPEAKEVAVLEFEATNGRYVWIVANGPSGEWWEIHEIDIFMNEIDDEDPVDPIDENEIPKDAWTAYATRYFEDHPPANAIDNDMNTKFGMGGGANLGRWFMVDMNESYLVEKIVLTYIPGEEWKDNYIRGFDVYVTDFVYPFQPAAGPKGQADDGDLFESDPDYITASVAYPEATETFELEFEPTQGRYIWIVSNGPSADWWEIHQFTAYGTLVDETNVREVSAPGFVFYPNPVSPEGRLTISMEKGVQGELIINDLAGRVVYRNSNLTQGQNTLFIDLKSGMYIISIEGKQAKKLIVK